MNDEQHQLCHAKTTAGQLVPACTCGWWSADGSHAAFERHLHAIATREDADGIPRRKPYAPDWALSEPVVDATGLDAPVRPRNAVGAHSAPNVCDGIDLDRWTWLHATSGPFRDWWDTNGDAIGECAALSPIRSDGTEWTVARPVVDATRSRIVHHLARVTTTPGDLGWCVSITWPTDDEGDRT